MHISHQYFTALGCALEIDQVAVSSFHVYCFDSRIIQELLPLSNGYFCAIPEMSTNLVVSGLIVASLIAHHRGRVIL